MRQARNRGFYVASVSVFISGLLVAGCGGSGSSDPLTKAEFIGQANSICREAEAARSKALRDASDSEPGVAELANDALPSVEQMTEELGELGAPADDRREVQAIVDAFNAGIEEVKADPADPAVAIAAFAEANELAEEYGLTDCAI